MKRKTLLLFSNIGLYTNYNLSDKLLVEFMKCFSCAQLVKVRCMTTFDPTNEVLLSINSHKVHMHRKLFFGKKIKNI